MQKNSLIILGSLMSGLILGGCESVRTSLGLDRQPPDEYSVMPSTHSLEMPPDFHALPTPQPGAPRPQEVTEFSIREQMGIRGGNDSLSPGQQALLKAAGAKKGHDAIRQQVDEEARMQQHGGEGVLEKFKIVKKKPPKGELVNPYEEVKRLKEKGIVHPQEDKIPSREG